MWKVLIVVAIVIGVFVYKQKTHEPSWVEHTSRDGGFAVTFPGAPQESTKLLTVRQSKVTMHLCEVKGWPRSFGVAYAEFPEDDRRPIADRLEGYMTNVFRDAYGRTERTMTGGRPINLGNMAGKEVSSWDGADAVTVRVYVRGNRLYALMAKSSIFDALPGRSERFLESFRLLE